MNQLPGILAVVVVPLLQTRTVVSSDPVMTKVPVGLNLAFNVMTSSIIIARQHKQKLAHREDTDGMRRTPLRGPVHP